MCCCLCAIRDSTEPLPVICQTLSLNSTIPSSADGQAIMNSSFNQNDQSCAGQSNWPHRNQKDIIHMIHVVKKKQSY